MDPHPTDSPSPRGPVETFARSYVHDARNSLNGVEMELSLLEQLSPTEDQRLSIARARDELAVLERQLSAVTLRLTPPKPEIASAHDIFTAWNSRSSKTRPGTNADQWHCGLTGELLDVDMRKVVDALCELLSTGGDHPLQISATPHENGVAFDVHHASPAPATTPLPGLDGVVEQNGGRYKEQTDPTTGNFFTSVWFPLATTD